MDGQLDARIQEGGKNLAAFRACSSMTLDFTRAGLTWHNRIQPESRPASAGVSSTGIVDA